MFSAVLLLSLSTLALGLATGDLKVSLTAVNPNVDSIDDIVISAVITNPTDKDIRILAKNNVLDPSATRSFAVSKDGSDVLFTGVRATYDFSAEGLYTTIPAGSSVAVNHTGLSPLYDFETHGTGKFTFSPNSIFQSTPDDPILHVKVDPLTITVKSDVQKRELIPLHKRTSTPTCSDAGRLQIIRDSLASARSLAGGAASDIRTHPTGPQWTSYFNGNSQDDIWYRMDLVAGDLDRAGVRTINCNVDPAGICGGTGGVIAYTLIVTSGGNIVGSNIYNCDYFFTSISTTPGTCGNYEPTQSSRGGVILHEMSHATVGTNDIIYGCNNCAALGTADKHNNADNYRCMGLAIFHDYNC